MDVSEKKALYKSPGEKGKRGFEDLEYYQLIREAEQALKGFMSYARRQRAGAQEFGNKKVGESPAYYDVTLFEAESD